MTMKKYTTTVVIGLLWLTMSCGENSSVVQPVSTSTNGQKNGARIFNYTFNGTEGDPISLDTSKNWVNNYVASNPLGIKAYFFGNAVLKSILAQSGCMGVRIYYAIDDSVNQQLLLIGADGNGNDLLPTLGISGKVSAVTLNGGQDSFNGTEGSSISAEIAKSWIANYGNNNPLRIQGHFFGFEIINQILAESGCIGIRIYYALNALGIQQLLLVGADANGGSLLPASNVGGRVSDGGNTVADMSFPCPAYCPG